MEIEITSENFEQEVINGEGLVLVFFRATWCQPCAAVSSAVGEVADKLGDKVKIGKINIDNEIALTTQHTVTSVPTILFFKDGEQLNRISGEITPKQLEELTRVYLEGEN